MNISERGLALIKQNEGFSAQAYFCPAGKATIGYGHVIGAGEKFPLAGISEKEAESILLQDVAAAERAVNTLVDIDLSQNQFDALVDFVYNIGNEAFEKSSLLRFLNNGDMQAASQQFKRWIYAGGKVMSGLITRRAAETQLFNA